MLDYKFRSQSFKYDHVLEFENIMMEQLHEMVCGIKQLWLFYAKLAQNSPDRPGCWRAEKKWVNNLHHFSPIGGPEICEEMFGELFGPQNNGGAS